jgi:sugar/nucleoside kinase (ribokinase family)
VAFLAQAGVLASSNEKPAGVLTTAGAADAAFAAAFLADIAVHRHWSRANAAAIAA